MPQYEELCKALGSLVGSHSNDTVELLQNLEQVIQVQHVALTRIICVRIAIPIGSPAVEGEAG